MELITKEDCSTMTEIIDSVINKIEHIKENYRPLFDGERYLSGKDLCKALSITSRTLQDYRDTNQVPFTRIGGNILYKESDIVKILKKNYVPRTQY